MQMEKLTEAEEVVMKAVWDCRTEPTLADVVKYATDTYKKDWKPQTVSSFLAKLVRKNYLKLQRVDKRYTYKPLVSEADYNRNRLNWLYVFLYKKNKECMEQDVKDL